MFGIKCHCGNIEISTDKIPTLLMRCNCSVCYRYAALWAYFTDKNTVIKIKNNSALSYSWGKEKIEFHHCTVCSCVTHYTSITESGESRVALNVRMADKKSIAGIAIRDFDGAENWR
jgi:hypothetical protein